MILTATNYIDKLSVEIEGSKGGCIVWANKVSEWHRFADAPIPAKVVRALDLIYLNCRNAGMPGFIGEAVFFLDGENESFRPLKEWIEDKSEPETMCQKAVLTSEKVNKALEVGDEQ